MSGACVSLSVYLLVSLQGCVCMKYVGFALYSLLHKLNHNATHINIHCKCNFLFHNIFSLLSIGMFEVDIVMWYWLEAGSFSIHSK